MPDKHEVDGSIPFEPTKANKKLAKFYRSKYKEEHIEKYIDD